MMYTFAVICTGFGAGLAFAWGIVPVLRSLRYSWRAVRKWRREASDDLYAQACLTDARSDMLLSAAVLLIGCALISSIIAGIVVILERW